MKAIRIACGNHYVRSARWSYFGVFEYSSQVLRTGEVHYGPGKLIAGPFRSRAKAGRIAERLATERGVGFVEGYGTLYGSPVEVSATALSV